MEKLKKWFRSYMSKRRFKRDCNDYCNMLSRQKQERESPLRERTLLDFRFGRDINTGSYLNGRYDDFI